MTYEAPQAAALFDSTPYAVKLRQFEQFGVPPLSVLDAGAAYWQARKAEWRAAYPALVGGQGRNEGSTGTFTHLLRGKDPVSMKLAELGDGDGWSVFDPFLAEIIYRWWTPVGADIYDPFAGGPARGLVADILGRNYVGVDIRQEQVDLNHEAYDGGARWVRADAARYVPDPCDFVVSCPPYGNLEIYSDDPSDLSTMSWTEFAASYRRCIWHAVDALRPNRYAVFVVGNYKERRQLRDLVGLTVAAFGEGGAQYYGDLVYVSPIGSASIRAQSTFPKNRRPMPRHQMVLVFVKGDGREAARYVTAGQEDEL